MVPALICVQAGLRILQASHDQLYFSSCCILQSSKMRRSLVTGAGLPVAISKLGTVTSWLLKVRCQSNSCRVHARDIPRRLPESQRILHALACGPCQDMGILACHPL